MRLVTITLILTASLAFAGHPKIAKDLDGADPSSNVDVIIQFKHPPTEAHHQMVRDKGGMHKRSLDLVKGSLYSVPAGKLTELADDPEVEYVTLDRPVSATLDFANPAINANIARQYGWDGNGVTAAVIDSGTVSYTHLTLPTIYSV